MKINGLVFDRANYGADGDGLYLARRETTEASDAALTPEGHGIRYDGEGHVIRVTIINARWLLERDGHVTITLPQEVQLAAGTSPAPSREWCAPSARLVAIKPYRVGSDERPIRAERTEPRSGALDGRGAEATGVPQAPAQTCPRHRPAGGMQDSHRDQDCFSSFRAPEWTAARDIELPLTEARGRGLGVSLRRRARSAW